MDTDLLQEFIGESLEFDPTARTDARDLRGAFNEYLAQRGHRAWTGRTFAARFGTRSECVQNGVQPGRVQNPVGPGARTVWSGVRLAACPHCYGKDGQHHVQCPGF